MRLFMILYTAAGISGTWGPLPYDEAECYQRAADFMEEIRDGAAQHPEAGSIDGWSVACEWRDQRPQQGVRLEPDSQMPRHRPNPH